MSMVSLLGLLVVTGLVQLGVSNETITLRDKRCFKFVFDRPMEPIFMLKGVYEEVVFNLPKSYLVDRYQLIEDDIKPDTSTSDVIEIIVHEVPIPDLSLPMRLKRHGHFSIFVPYYRRMAQYLIDIFMGMKTYEDFLSIAIYCRPRMNPFMWVYAMSITILHRMDTRDIELPQYTILFPEKFFPADIITRMRSQANIFPPENRIPIVIPRDYTATDKDLEHRLAYFREDLGVNLHHWHWHLVYPFNGSLNIVNKDRRGELFYYVHEQFVARYNFERFSNKLSRVERLNNWRIPIPEGYFPKLNNIVASRVWPPRQADTLLRDINREDVQLKFDIQDLERWRDRMFEAIHLGKVRKTNGNYVSLLNPQGINILGNMMEASILSINPNLYGDLHNLGHLVIAYCHDPDYRNLEDEGVMAENPTSMRDPIFYRWHSFVDDVFQAHKKTLPPYTSQQLGFNGIQLTDVAVQVEGETTNVFSTFWQQSDIELSRGIDFAPRGPLFVRVTHLQHLPFTYNIKVTNSGQRRIGTVRIFMAPKFDERNLPIIFSEQKLLFIELDKFQVTLQTGENVIQRPDSKSSVTVPYERTYRNLDANRPSPNVDGGNALDQFNYCGCGWPANMLIPKGTIEGLPAELFVMVSNYDDDKVDQPPSFNTCQDAHSYCGIKGHLYPDRRAMGYPFDHFLQSEIQMLSDLLTPNMKMINVSIRFSDITVPPGDGITHVRFPANNAGRPTYLDV